MRGGKGNYNWDSSRYAEFTIWQSMSDHWVMVMSEIRRHVLQLGN
jgi:hypothetical protein